MYTVLFIATLFISLGRLGTEMINPALPMIESTFTAHTVPVEFIITSYLIGFTIAQFIGGIWSDYVGRKRILIIGSLAFAVGSALCTLESSWTLFLLSRVLMGVGIGVGPSVGRALLSDRCPKENLINVMATLNNALVITSVIGPILAGWLLMLGGYQVNFIFLSLLGVLGLISTALFIQEPKRQATLYSTSDLFASMGELFRNKVFVAATLMNGFAFGMMTVFGQEASLTIIQKMGYIPTDFGYVMGFVALSYFVGGMLAKKLNKHFNAQQILKLAFTGITITAFLTAVVVSYHLSIASYVLPIIIIFALCRTIVPVCGALSVSGQSKAGMASAFFGVGYIGFSSLLSFLFAVGFSNNPTALFSVYGILGALGILTVKWSR